MKKNYKRNWRFTLKLLAVFGAMLSAGSASAQLSGMYTIDPATARGGTNFQSFEELEDTLDSDGISGVVTIDVLANSGPYDVGSLSLSSLAGFSGANSLTINGNGDTLRGRSNVLEIEDVSNITFNNLVIEKTSGTGNLVIIRDEASNIMFDNCEIISRKSGGFDAYVLIGDNSTDVNTITIQNCKIWNGLTVPSPNGEQYAIEIDMENGNNDDSEIEILNNDISGFHDRGISLDRGFGVEVIGNEFHNELCTDPGFAIRVLDATHWPNSANNNSVEFSNNYIHDIATLRNQGCDVWAFDVDFDGAAIAVIINNNIFDLEGGDNIELWNGWANTSGGIFFTGNTVIMNKFGTDANVNHTFFDFFNAIGGTIRNNIFLDESESIWTAGVLEFVRGFNAGGISYDNNTWARTNAAAIVPNSAIGNVGGTRYLTLNTWTAGPGGLASLDVDPQLLDRANGGYSPTSVAMANKGSTVVGAPLTDYAGVARNSTTPDIGALEYVVDVELVSVDMTGTSECAPYTEDVVITLRNNGLDSISNVPMQYSVNGGPAVTEIVTGPILSGASMSFTFTRAVTLNGSNTHVITAEVDGEDDLPANSDAAYTIMTTASPDGGTLSMGALFDGYFNTGTMGDPDATVNTYQSNFAIGQPTKYAGTGPGTDYSYSLVATTGGSTDVSTGNGFEIVGEELQANPLVSLAGETIFLEVSVLDANTGCDTAFGRYMYVPHTPVPSFDAADICLGNTSQFKNTSTLGGTSYIVTSWEFADPDLSVTDDNSDIRDGFWEYTTYGNNVNVEMTVANGQYPKFEYTAINTINVTPIPDIDFKVLNACEGLPITILNITTSPTNDPISYTWDFAGEATSTDVNPVYTFATPGQRQISVLASANGCDATLTKNAYQFEKPVADFSSTGECNFVDVVFNNESTIPNGAGMGFAWDFNSVAISREESPAYAFATAGAKTVVLTATSEFGFVDMISKVVNLNVSPEADFTFDAACNLTPINFTRTGTANESQSTWAWDFDGESTSGQENPTYLFDKVGAKEVTLTIADLNGCRSSITKEVEVVLQAVADFEAGSVCEGDKAVFTNNSTVAAGDLTYVWTFGDGPTATSTDLSPTYAYTTPRTYNVTLEAIVAGGCSDQITKPVVVNPAPVAAFTFVKDGRSVVFNGPEGNDQYRWTFGDGGKDQLEDPTYTYVNQDIATLEACLATKKGECWSESCETISINLVGVDELTKNNSMINVYPNPSNGQFSVTVENAGEVEVKVGDILGNTMNVSVVDNLNGTYSVDMSAVADGVYFVQVKNGDF